MEPFRHTLFERVSFIFSDLLWMEDVRIQVVKMNNGFFISNSGPILPVIPPFFKHGIDSAQSHLSTENNADA